MKYKGARGSRIKPAASTALPVATKKPQKKVRPIYRNGKFVFQSPEEKPDEG